MKKSKKTNFALLLPREWLVTTTTYLIPLFYSHNKISIFLRLKTKLNFKTNTTIKKITPSIPLLKHKNVTTTKHTRLKKKWTLRDCGGCWHRCRKVVVWWVFARQFLSCFRRRSSQGVLWWRRFFFRLWCCLSCVIYVEKGTIMKVIFLVWSCCWWGCCYGLCRW